MTIAEKIYKLRTKSGFSQEVFAEKLDVTRSEEHTSELQSR